MLTNRILAGDFAWAMNITLSGNNFQKMALFSKFMRLRAVTQSVFDRITSMYVNPGICEYWSDLQADTLSKLKEQDLVLAGTSMNNYNILTIKNILVV